jgi:hypothetical protein
MSFCLKNYIKNNQSDEESSYQTCVQDMWDYIYLTSLENRDLYVAMSQKCIEKNEHDQIYGLLSNMALFLSDIITYLSAGFAQLKLPGELKKIQEVDDDGTPHYFGEADADADAEADANANANAEDEKKESGGLSRVDILVQIDSNVREMMRREFVLDADVTDNEAQNLREVIKEKGAVGFLAELWQRKRDKIESVGLYPAEVQEIYDCINVSVEGVIFVLGTLL